MDTVVTCYKVNLLYLCCEAYGNKHWMIIMTIMIMMTMVMMIMVRMMMIDDGGDNALNNSK